MGLIPFLCTWACVDGNTISLHTSSYRYVGKNLRKFSSQAQSQLCVHSYTNTCAHTHTTCVCPHTSISSDTPYLMPVVEDFASLRYAPTWVCLREKMRTLTKLVIFSFLCCWDDCFNSNAGISSKNSFEKLAYLNYL